MRRAIWLCAKNEGAGHSPRARPARARKRNCFISLKHLLMLPSAAHLSRRVLANCAPLEKTHLEQTRNALSRSAESETGQASRMYSNEVNFLPLSTFL
jgi:hypothetical protein